MNEETRKRMEEQAEKHRDDIAKLDGIIGEKTPPLIAYYKFIAGYTAAHTDAQGEIARLQDKIHTERKILNEQHSVLMAVRDTEIEKLKAENSKLKENIQWLELDIKDMRELYLSNDSKLTLERAASAELLKALEWIKISEILEDTRENKHSVMDRIRMKAEQALAAHNARQKERG